MTKLRNAPETIPPHMVRLFTKYGIKPPHIEAVELLDLLTDLSEIDLPLPLLERIRSAKSMLMAQSRGGRKGAEASKKTRRGPQSKRAAIIEAAAKYDKPTSAQVAAIARSSGSTVRYVRMVLAPTIGKASSLRS